MDALRQSILRAQLSKPIGRATRAAMQSAQPRAAQSAGASHTHDMATIEARFSALDRKLDALIDMLAGSGDGGDGVRQLLVPDIRQAVTSYFGVSEAEIDRVGRSPRIVRIRQIAIYPCRIHTTRSLPELGRLFGHRHHSTILHGARRIAARRKTDAALDRDLSQLEARLADIEARRSELTAPDHSGT
jgi:hypothetical protein